MKKLHTTDGFGALAIVLIVAVVVALGAGGYFAAKKSADVNTDMMSGSDDVARNDMAMSSKTSIKSLLALGKDMMCTFQRTDANGSTEGTVYISGGDVRGDFTSMMKSSGSVDSHMIRMGDKNYVWSSAQGNQGVMMTISDSVTAQTNTNAQAQGSLDVDENLDYQCSPWSKDSSKFTPPSDIKFMDMSAMMNLKMTR